MQQQLIKGTYRPGAYRSFEVHDPKRRLVSAAPYGDRVLHHAICLVIEPLFEKRFVSDSFACRQGKGQVAALLRCRQHARQLPYVLKVDFQRYFPSIDHEILLTRIERTIRDQALMDLLRKIIQHPFPGQQGSTFFPRDDLFSVAHRTCGLPIGNQTSQLFGNVYLDPLDHYIKEVMRVAGYVRYMDDLLLFAESKRQAWQWLEILEQRADRMRLRLHPRKRHVIPTGREFPFLGFHVSPAGFRPFAGTVVRFRRRLKQLQSQLDQGVIDLHAVQQTVASYAGHFKIARQTNRWRNILQDFPFFESLVREHQQRKKFSRARSARLPTH